ncbi:zinc finger ccch domain-containing protein 14 [Quercus suber]|uniref:Zinc finger ccch domain-containing protein 14 n=1 Tax=Quercus suber TaxID=58331 RepID=A0AAW0IUJ6_QUESU
MSNPSTCSSSIDDAVSSTQNHLNQAPLILQYQELNDHYNLCRARHIVLLSCSSSIDDAVSSTQNHLNQARLILQYQELNDHYDLCRAHHIVLLSEAEYLRHENAELYLANAKLLKLLSSQASFHNLLLSSSYPTEAIVKKRTNDGTS